MMGAVEDVRERERITNALIAKKARAFVKAERTAPRWKVAEALRELREACGVHHA